ncbi:hypothetical protein DLJ47_25360 [Micromonospora sp. S4605]|nr:hypothetical protein DLJ47_25360 [Micromonospora sp. S4605]
MSVAVAATSPDAAVVVLPEFFERGIAVFPAYLTPVVKTLRADGIGASFLNGERGRTFRSTFSAEPAAIFVGIMLNMLSNGLYDAVKVTFQLLRLRLAEMRNPAGADTTTLRMALPRNADGTGLLWQEIIGPSDKVLAYAEAAARRHLSAAGTSAPKPEN